jgi:uncharacterized protein (TIGR02996 family)
MLLVISHVDDAFDPHYVLVTEGATYLVGGSVDGIRLADSTVSSPHARLTVRATDVLVEDLGSEGGTFVDDRRIVEPTVVALGDPIRVGETLLAVTLGERVPDQNYYEQREDLREIEFLTALRANPADDSTRIVYADWLEGEGHRITAHYIRRELEGDIDIRHEERIDKAVGITQPEWRALISRGPIGACQVHDCPRTWHQLPASAKDFERACPTCLHTVQFCISHEDARNCGLQQRRVVFDAGLSRGGGARSYYSAANGGEGMYEDAAYGFTAANRLFERQTGRFRAVEPDDDDTEDD